jgi:hypothetical protein
MKVHSNFPIIFFAIGFEIFVDHVHILHILHLMFTFFLGRMMDFDFFSRLTSLKSLSFMFMCLTHYFHPPHQHSSWRMMMVFEMIGFFESFVIHIHVSCPLASPTKARLILEDDDVF